MSRKPIPPEVFYEYLATEDKRAIDDVFNFLFDKFFNERSNKM
jgi:hypothetical protein